MFKKLHTRYNYGTDSDHANNMAIHLLGYGYRYVAPLFSKDTTQQIYGDEFYQNDFPRYVDSTYDDHKWHMTKFDNHFQRPESFLRRVLDAGYSLGQLLKTTTHRGWSVHSVQLGRIACDFAPKNGAYPTT